MYHLLKDGVKVACRDTQGIETIETVRMINWNESRNNDFFLTSQFWITGDYHTRRPDLVGFVNGIPLLLVEFKAAHKNLFNA